MKQRAVRLWTIFAGASIVLFATSCFLFHGSIKLEAQIDYKIGGPQPVARTKFYLLNMDLLEIARAAHAANDPSKQAALSALDDLIKQSLYGKASTVSYDIDNAKPLWEPFLVQTQETDFKGIATFGGLPPADYWLLGVTDTRGGYAFWNYKVSVGRGENHVMLGDNNAAYAK